MCIRVPHTYSATVAFHGFVVLFMYVFKKHIYVETNEVFCESQSVYAKSKVYAQYLYLSYVCALFVVNALLSWYAGEMD